MLASELIKELGDLIVAHGDLEVIEPGRDEPFTSAEYNNDDGPCIVLET